MTLLTAITSFTNRLLKGECPPDVHPLLFGGALTALAKKDGGIRPIAVGSVWRRLAAKCASRWATAHLSSYFRPGQLGVGVKGVLRQQFTRLADSSRAWVRMMSF